MRTFVVGDTHGNVRGFKQVLERAQFDKKNDTLICLGDIADGWPFVYELVEEFLTIDNLVKIRGNHDVWAMQWFKYGRVENIWYTQGGKETMDSYTKNPTRLVDPRHKAFWLEEDWFYYYIDEQRLFVHAGFDYRKAISNQLYMSDYYWDRSLWNHLLGLENYNSGSQPLVKIKNAIFYISDVGKSFRSFNEIHKAVEKGEIEEDNIIREVYIGHTALGGNSRNIHKKEIFYPKTLFGVTNMDTGAGFAGNCSMMNIDTKEVFVSDTAADLYQSHEFSGRI